MKLYRNEYGTLYLLNGNSLKFYDRSQGLWERACMRDLSSTFYKLIGNNFKLK